MPSSWLFQIRRDTALGFSTDNPVLLNEEIGKEVDSGLFKIGDGVKTWSQLGYCTVDPGLSILPDVSTEAGNMISTSSADRGFLLLESVFNTLSDFNGAYAGTITDVTPYTTANQRKVLSVRTGILFRLIVQALGSSFTNLLSSTAPTQTVSELLSLINTNLTTLNSLINDGAPALNKVWSSTHTNAQIAAGISALVGTSPATLNAIDELAAALGNDPNFATTVATALGNTVKIVSQSLTVPQQAQARANIGAASIADASGLTPTPIKTAYYVANINEMVRVDSTAGAFIILVPANPEYGQRFGILDVGKVCATNNVSINANSGKKVSGSATGIALDVNGGIGEFMFVAATDDWQLLTTSFHNAAVTLVATGGTGATSAAGALANLGAMAVNGWPIVHVTTTTYTAVVASEHNIESVAPSEIMLPANPAEGWACSFCVDNALATNTINFNGKNHENSTDPTMLIDNKLGYVIVRFVNNKWRVR